MSRTKVAEMGLHDRIRRYHGMGLPASGVALIVDVSRSYVYSVLATPRPDRMAVARERQKVFAELRRAGLTYAEIGRRCQVTDAAVRASLNKAVMPETAGA